MFELLINEVNKANSIIIFPHTNMDGDSVGSARALCIALKKLGKDVYILADEDVPDYVAFLKCDCFKTEYDGKSFDLAFAVDCSENQRIENRLVAWFNAKKRVCIDHHPGSEGFADYIVRDSQAAAAASLVLDFIKELGVEIDKTMASALYTGILTDTGAFKYSNADAKSHSDAAFLLGYGINSAEICSYVYDNKPYRELKIESHALKKAEFLCDRRAVISYVSYKYWNSINAKYSHTDTAIDTLRSIRGVEIAAVLKEKEPGVYKVSLRSKNYADVSAIAVKFGGGGHKKAAACTITSDLETAKKLLKEEICKALS